MNPKISIIVPVYKVEPYLRRCIDSILNQTFTNFELILVDDGSPDRCGEICDEYAKKDCRIKVIHKKNGGLSSARNIGLNIAKGDYIGFVDSDDWIDADMYETLYNLIKESNKSISNIGYKIVYDNYSECLTNHKVLKLNKEQALEELLKHKLYGNYFWPNLYTSELMKKFRFTENIIFEDLDLMYRVISESNGIITVGMSKYNYLQREGSITNDLSINIGYDYIFILNKRKKDLQKNYKKLYQKYKDKINDNL
ncbi:MAG: glycosyltransferase family 2 protein, partial [Cetobacterium sp.]